MQGKIVSYRRVSTERQGQSGLGLDAQKVAVQQYADAHGDRVVADYTEVETGKRDSLANRPELRRAIAHAKRSKATLVVAKLDRLARSVAVTSILHQTGVEFVCCDNPNVNRMTVQILAAVAENETRAISDRTKEALAAYKARGGALGASRHECRNLTPAARTRGSVAASRARRDKAREAYADLVAPLRRLRADGLSFMTLAARLNEEGQTTRRGRPWNAAQVRRVLKYATMSQGSQ
jgi:DNA invertase Pin-like site-specific DNA recombinase